MDQDSERSKVALNTRGEGERVIGTRDAMILNLVEDCQRDKVVKNSERDCLGSWTQGFYEDRTDEHKSLPHFSFLLSKAKFTF